MIRLKWSVHPVLIFIFSIVTVLLSLILYIYWYVEISSGLKAVIEKSKIDPGQILAPQTWVVVLVLSVLVGLIFIGIFVIFIYNQKTLQLYQLQRNFINNFTHELKTPVASLKLYLETFRKHQLSREKQLRYLNYMIRDVDCLSENINLILNLARIESKTIKNSPININIVSFVQEFCQKNSHIFNSGEIHINNPAGFDFECRIDPSLFEILLMNLLTNAFKYNSSDVPRVDITFLSRNRKLYILFEDNGIGLPPNETRKIFRKFYRIKQHGNAPTGSGLGLHTAEAIARLHKGKIIAENRKGKGSVFKLILPLEGHVPIRQAPV